MSRQRPSWMRPIVALAASVALAVSISSCSQSKPESAEGDLTSAAGYKIHFQVQLVQSGIVPVAYKITLSNVGAKALTFKPSPPDCTLYMEPNSYTTTPFRREEATGLQVDENGSVKLEPGHTCTLQLAFSDMQSPLRGSAHDCQLALRPEESSATIANSTDPYAQAVDPQPLKSKVFRILVP